MGWFDRKKPEQTRKPKSEEEELAEALQSPVIKQRLQHNEILLHQTFPGSDQLMPLHEAMVLPVQERLAYGNELVALYENKTGQSFFVPKRPAQDRELLLESPQEIVEQALKHLRILDQFPVGENTERSTPEPNSEYHDQFDQMMGFLMKRLDRSQPMVDQVSRLIDAVNLDHIGTAITKSINDKDQTVMRGKLKDRVVKYLIAMNKM